MGTETDDSLENRIESGYTPISPARINEKKSKIDVGFPNDIYMYHPYRIRDLIDAYADREKNEAVIQEFENTLSALEKELENAKKENLSRKGIAKISGKRDYLNFLEKTANFKCNLWMKKDDETDAKYNKDKSKFEDDCKQETDEETVRYKKELLKYETNKNDALVYEMKKTNWFLRGAQVLVSAGSAVATYLATDYFTGNAAFSLAASLVPAGLITIGIEYVQTNKLNKIVKHYAPIFQKADNRFTTTKKAIKQNYDKKLAVLDSKLKEDKEDAYGKVTGLAVKEALVAAAKFLPNSVILYVDSESSDEIEYRVEQIEHELDYPATG
jgi:hypothetical protein